MVGPDTARRSGAAGIRREAGRRGRTGAIFGAAAAALASAGLVYWISLSKDPALGAPPVQVELPAAPERAPTRADAAQVIRAHEQLQDEYAAGGPAAVARVADACATDLGAHPGNLDFCLAYNRFARSLAPEASQLGEERELLLIRAALPPGEDAWERLGQIRALVRQVSLQDSPGRAIAVSPSPPQDAPASAARDATAKSAAARSAAIRASAACRRRAPAAPRTVCSSPALRSADLRLRVAYRKAADAGVGSRVLDRDQRRFRVAVQKAAPDRASVARLYARRIRTLESQARRAGG